MSIRIEDEKIVIEEDVKVIDAKYDIVNETLIARETIEKIISTKMFNYGDGVSIYFKVDDSGMNQFIDVIMVLYETNKEKKIVSVPRNADIDIHRIDRCHFNIVIDDKQNNAGSFIFVLIKPNNTITVSKLDYTRLVEYKIVDDAFVLLNNYEDLDDGKKCIYQMSVYNLSGKLLKTLLDKIVSKDYSFEFVVQHNPKGKRNVAVIRTNGRKTRIIEKYELPD